MRPEKRQEEANSYHLRFFFLFKMVSQKTVFVLGIEQPDSTLQFKNSPHCRIRPTCETHFVNLRLTMVIKLFFHSRV